MKKPKKNAFNRTPQKYDWIAYPGRYSSSLWMNVACIVGVEKDTLTVVAKSLGHWGGKTAHLTTISRVDRTIPLSPWDIPSSILQEIDDAMDKIESAKRD